MEYTEKELEQERWKDIFGYEGMYQVSDLGRVRSKHRGEWTVLKQKNSRCGYFRIGLWKDRKQKFLLVHRIVAQAFIPNDNLFNDQVNHKDENKQNNRASNLEWCDRYYNMHYNGLYNRRKQQHQPKRDKRIELYNPNLSVDDNLKVFKENGVECSKTTLWYIRRGIKCCNLKHRSTYKANKVKDLYNPDLTYEQNIELFMENGIECSKNTIRELRRDLGLIKNNSTK